MKTEAWIKWRKLKKKQCCLDFRAELRQNLGGKESTSEVLRKLVFGVSFGQRKDDKETWRCHEELLESIQRKRLAK